MTAPLKDVTPAERARSTSFYEASARTRLELLLDAGSLIEFIGPEQREVSPHSEDIRSSRAVRRRHRRRSRPA